MLSEPTSRAILLVRRLHRTVPPTTALRRPAGDVWLHEIEHDGFRLIAPKTGDRVRLYSRPGNDLTHRFPPVVEAVVAPLHRRR